MLNKITSHSHWSMNSQSSNVHNSQSFNVHNSQSSNVHNSQSFNVHNSQSFNVHNSQSLNVHNSQSFNVHNSQSFYLQKSKKGLLWPGASQWRIYYHRMWGQLSTTCSNVLNRSMRGNHLAYAATQGIKAATQGLLYHSGTTLNRFIYKNKYCLQITCFF